MNMFNIPEEVIWEMSMDDCFERNHEAQADLEYELQTEQDIQNVKRFSRKHLVKCPQCGHNGLEWVDTKFGMRLVYAIAPKKHLAMLIGKIHACSE